MGFVSCSDHPIFFSALPISVFQILKIDWITSGSTGAQTDVYMDEPANDQPDKVQEVREMFKEMKDICYCLCVCLSVGVCVCMSVYIQVRNFFL